MACLSTLDARHFSCAVSGWSEVLINSVTLAKSGRTARSFDRRSIGLRPTPNHLRATQSPHARINHWYPGYCVAGVERRGPFNFLTIPPSPNPHLWCTVHWRCTRDGRERAGGGSTKRARSRIKMGKVLNNALYFALEKGLKGEIQERRGRNRKCKAFKRITRGGRFRPLPPYLLLRERGLYQKYQAMQ